MAAKTSSTKTTTTKRTTKSAPPPAMTVETQSPTNEEIARRAFELYVARGREHGRAQEDWLNAERELRARYSVS